MADILKLSEEEKTSIILSGSSELGNEMVLDFNGNFEEEGTGKDLIFLVKFIQTLSFYK